MTRAMFALSLVPVLAVTVAAGAAEPKVTLTTGDSADLAVSTRTTPVLVTNFPVDEDGNLRVNVQRRTSNPLVLELVPAAVELPTDGSFRTELFDVSDAELITVALDGVPCQSSAGSTALDAVLEWRVAPDLPFAPCKDARGESHGARVLRAAVYLYPLIATSFNCGGTEARLLVGGSGPCDPGQVHVVNSVRVLLRPR